MKLEWTVKRNMGGGVVSARASRNGVHYNIGFNLNNEWYIDATTDRGEIKWGHYTKTVKEAMQIAENDTFDFLDELEAL
jgi:hypothetical protein